MTRRAVITIEYVCGHRGESKEVEVPIEPMNSLEGLPARGIMKVPKLCKECRTERMITEVWG